MVKDLTPDFDPQNTQRRTERTELTKLVGVQVYLLSSKEMCGCLPLVLQNPKISPTPCILYCLLVWFLIL